MPNEIERKFLVSEVPPGLGDYRSNEIAQGYLAITPEGIEIRVRRKGEKYYETVKSGMGLKRGEVEIVLGEEGFEALWPLTEEMRIEKTRYEIPYGGHVIELDVYSGALGGLVVAEIEFKSKEESRQFTPPEWLGREITGDVRYSNAHLALHGRPQN
jgi:adenylate cyclase